MIRGCLGLADDNREFWVVFVEFWGEMMHDRALQSIKCSIIFLAVLVRLKIVERALHSRLGIDEEVGARDDALTLCQARGDRVPTTELPG